MLVMNTVMRVGFHEIWGMHILAEDLLASQKGLAAWSYDVMELVGYLIN
jgi:hypothetical protein